MSRILTAIIAFSATIPLIVPAHARQEPASIAQQQESSVSQTTRPQRAQVRPPPADAGAIERLTELPQRHPSRMEVLPLPSRPSVSQPQTFGGIASSSSQSSAPNALRPSLPLVGGQAVPLVLTPPPVSHSSPDGGQLNPGTSASVAQNSSSQNNKQQSSSLAASPPHTGNQAVSSSTNPNPQRPAAERLDNALRDRRAPTNAEAAQQLAASARASRINGMWVARQGQTLRSTLEAWGREAGWRIAWRADHEYTLMASAEFQGTFEDAAGTLIEAFANASPPIFGRFYAGNRVLVITNPQDADLN